MALSDSIYPVRRWLGLGADRHGGLSPNWAVWNKDKDGTQDLQAISRGRRWGLKVWFKSPLSKLWGFLRLVMWTMALCNFPLTSKVWHFHWRSSLAMVLEVSIVAYD